MHLLRTDVRSLDETVEAVDLGQTPADIVALSFSDSDLAGLSAAWQAQQHGLPSLRLANLAQLRHPFSTDRYIEQVASHARIVLVRLLGGLDYWRYGIEELARAARRDGFALAVVPGDWREDERLNLVSTLPNDDLRRIFAYFQNGGPDNLRELLRFIAARIDGATVWREPQALPPFGLFEAGCRMASEGAPRALILLYRSTLLASDTRPIEALADALRARGCCVRAAFLTSLKDETVVPMLRGWLREERPDVIVNTTAFSARADTNGNVLDFADCPVLQAVLAQSSLDQWQGEARGLSAADLAMNVVLPEIDGRVLAGAISFKTKCERSEALEFTRFTHEPEPTRIAHVADLATAWVRLRRKPRSKRLIACVMSDYPGKGGRAGYAVGLDTPASVLAIANALRAAGYDIGVLPQAADLMATLVQDPSVKSRGDAAFQAGEGGNSLSLTTYRELIAKFPPTFVGAVVAAWGPPESDPAIQRESFQFRAVQCSGLIVAVQPDRGRKSSRKSDYHDPNLPPRHAYIAFYLWLRECLRVDAMIHCGTHGTLEWLPGKSVALSQACAPEAVLGAVPVVYPFIVNNPGEAAQAKRRIAALTIGHMTPPLIEAGHHGATSELEALFDEYASAQALDSRRTRLLSQAIIAKASEIGLAEEIGLRADQEASEALASLDAWLCDLKDMRIGDGLHVFGRSAPLELTNLIHALDGGFVEPGPAGAPSRGRLDVLPTGRNLFTVDPRAVPTRAAWQIGSRTASEVLRRHAQDHGEWPRRLVIDIWGSATMRTGGDDLAQALALIGVRPVWDDCSTRVSGFEILSLAKLGRPRVDVTLRISGLFRDVFPSQIALFDEAVRALAALDEEAEDNPLAAEMRVMQESGAGLPLSRIFGAAPGAYGIGVVGQIAADSSATREMLGEVYLAASSHAYGAHGLLEGVEASAAFRRRVATADAFVHVQDMAGQDVLDADAFADHEGGFSAAAMTLGAEPALYHVDTTRPQSSTVRTLPEEIARVVRGRATNPRWIAGQMRHGFRGAAEIADTIDNLFAFAVTTELVSSGQFDLAYDAICGHEEVREFLRRANPQAAHAVAARFAEAARRGYWVSRRNSSAAQLAEMMDGAT